MRQPRNRTDEPVRGRLLVLGSPPTPVLDAIQAAAPSLGLTNIRAELPSGQIDDVWRELQRAELVVADLGEPSPQTLYELGLASALNKRLVLLRSVTPSAAVEMLGLPIVDLVGTEPADHARRITVAIAAALAEPMVEMDLVPLGGRNSVPVHDGGVVIDVDADRAVVKSDGGKRAALYPPDLTWTRIVKDLRRLLTVGDRLDGIYFIDRSGEARFSVTALEENPWPALTREFPIDRTFLGRVHSWVPDVGLFVALTGGINGLVPRSTLSPSEGFIVGEEVLAKPVRIDEDRRIVELRLARRKDETPDAADAPKWRAGQLTDAVIVHVSPKHDYVLVDLPDGSTAMLHATRMSPQLQRDLPVLSVGDAVRVRVLSVDAEQDRILVADRPTSFDADAGDLSPPVHHVERSPETHLLESQFLDAVVQLEPYVFLAERRPRNRWPVGTAPDLSDSELETVDRWHALYREEIAAVWRTRNRLVHARAGDDRELEEALGVARRLILLLTEPDLSEAPPD